MPRTDFDDSWKEWIRTNVERGCSRDELFRILVDEGFERNAVRDALGHEPSVDLSLIVNPLKPASRDRVARIAGGATAPTRETIANLQRIDTPALELYLAEHFLSAELCGRVTALMRTALRDSTITAAAEPDPHFRRSKTCDLGLIRDPAVREMDAKICAALRTTDAWAEPTQGQHYDPGGEFKPHTDYFEAAELERFSTPTLGQRTWTFMVYLNEPEAGGETAFVTAGIVVKPRLGLAVIWNNQRPDGTPNPGSLHHGMPVTAGYKDIITKWFRERK